MAFIGSKSKLAIKLSQLKGFEQQKVKAEQYPTDPEIAAQVLWNAYLLGDLEGKVSVDLGCGTGILGIGALYLGNSKVYFVDSDKEALDIAKINVSRVKSESSDIGEAVFLCQDMAKFNKKVDLVLQNAPFGTKVRHADREFLKKAVKLADTIYSFHKSETKGFVEAFAKDSGFEISHCWDFRFPLKQAMSFHRRKIHRINVSCFRLIKAKLFK
ncbi:METTL5 family protein [Candidatus Woesearchaeota archaeon]|nr:METTL5 family protein [Candidatus Woesearchaeota archaeon]